MRLLEKFHKVYLIVLFSIAEDNKGTLMFLDVARIPSGCIDIGM